MPSSGTPRDGTVAGGRCRSDRRRRAGTARLAGVRAPGKRPAGIGCGTGRRGSRVGRRRPHAHRRRPGRAGHGGVPQGRHRDARGRGAAGPSQPPSRLPWPEVGGARACRAGPSPRALDAGGTRGGGPQPAGRRPPGRGPGGCGQADRRATGRRWRLDLPGHRPAARRVGQGGRRGTGDSPRHHAGRSRRPRPPRVGPSYPRRGRRRYQISGQGPVDQPGLQLGARCAGRPWPTRASWNEPGTTWSRR